MFMFIIVVIDDDEVLLEFIVYIIELELDV